LLSDEEYERRRSQLLKQKARLADELTGKGGHFHRPFDAAAETFAGACEVTTRFARGDVQDKKRILNDIGSNLVLMDGKLSIEAKIPFRILEDALPSMAGIPCPIEPGKYGPAAGRMGFRLPAIPSRCGDPNDVRTYGRNWQALVLKILRACGARRHDPTHRQAA
jgi:hypothetical protein